MPGDGRKPRKRHSQGHLGWPTGAASRPSPGCPGTILDDGAQVLSARPRPVAHPRSDGTPKPCLASRGWPLRQAQEALKNGAWKRRIACCASRPRRDTRNRSSCSSRWCAASWNAANGTCARTTPRPPGTTCSGRAARPRQPRRRPAAASPGAAGTGRGAGPVAGRRAGPRRRDRHPAAGTLGAAAGVAAAGRSGPRLAAGCATRPAAASSPGPSNWPNGCGAAARTRRAAGPLPEPSWKGNRDRFAGPGAAAARGDARQPAGATCSNWPTRCWPSPPASRGPQGSRPGLEVGGAGDGRDAATVAPVPPPSDSGRAGGAGRSASCCGSTA